MAGRPRRKHVLGILKSRAVDSIGPDATALDYVANWLADGRTLVALAREIGASPNAVRDALAAEHGGDRDGVNARLTRARAIGATVLLEETQAIADAVPEDKNAIAKAKLQVEVRKALAGYYNPELYGERRPAVQINIGAMHLDALRLRHSNVPGISNPQTQALPAAEVLTVQEDTGAVPNDAVGGYVEYPPPDPTG